MPERHQERQVPQRPPPGDLAEQLPLGEDEERAGRAGRQHEQAGHEQPLAPDGRLQRRVHVVEAGPHQQRQQHRQRVADRAGQVEEGLGLDRPRQRPRPQDAGQQLDAGLGAALGPAVGLLLEADHLRRQLGRGRVLGQVDELPALELGPVAQVQVFGQRVVLPAAGVVDRGAAPDAGGAVEVHEPAAAVAGRVLDDEVAVEEDRLALGQQAGVAVEVVPADLDHADLGVGEVVDHVVEDVDRRDEVGVEDGDVIAGGLLQPLGQRPGLVPGAVGPVQVGDRVAEGGHLSQARRAMSAEWSVLSSSTWISSFSRG